MEKLNETQLSALYSDYIEYAHALPHSKQPIPVKQFYEENKNIYIQERSNINEIETSLAIMCLTIQGDTMKTRLSDRITQMRADRPDEWQMDDLARWAKNLENESYDEYVLKETCELTAALKQLISIVEIHSAATKNHFAWAELELANEVLGNT